MQHYQKDKLCLWEPVRAVWERMRDRHGLNVYINDLDFSSSPLINPNYHDTGKFLLTQKAFWNEFQLFKPHGFEGRCTTASLGRNQEALEELRQVGYDSLSGRLQYSRSDSHSNVQRCFCDTCERSWLCAGWRCIRVGCVRVQILREEARLFTRTFITLYIIVLVLHVFVGEC